MKNLFTKLSVCLLMASSLFLTSCSTNSDEILTASEKNNTLEVSSGKLATTYTIKRYVFNRESAVGGLGHVGVGFEVRTTNPTSVIYYYGGVENSKGSPAVGLGGANGGWWGTTASGSIMFSVMKNTYGYSRYKFEKAFMNISTTRVTNSINEIKYFPNRGYLLLGNNCMNASYDVLNQGGGLILPNPTIATSLAYIPNNWYNLFVSFNGWSGSVNL